MDQSSAPWRAFDAPSSAGRGGPGESAAPGAKQGAATASSDLKLAIAGVLGAIAIGALALVIAVVDGGAETIEGPGAAGSGAGGEGPGFAMGEVVVDVAGAVVAPGVYRLAVGSRVGDAITAAGGFSPRVDADRVSAELNLAATLSDGAQVRVPFRDETGHAGSGAGPGPKGAGGADGRTVNLNTASQSELETLPGIGPVTAGKIIASRSSSPFISVDELRERGLVGEKTFESIRALVSIG